MSIVVLLNNASNCQYDWKVLYIYYLACIHQLYSFGASCHHGCRINKLLCNMALTDSLLQNLPEYYRIKPILLYFQRFFFIKYQIKKKIIIVIE